MKVLKPVYLLVAVAFALNACGGGSGSGVKGDETSRRNAFNASLQSSSDVAGNSQKTQGVSSSARASAYAMAMGEDIAPGTKFENIEMDCEISGSATFNLVINDYTETTEGQSLDMSISTQFNECVEEETGKISGPLQMGVKAQTTGEDLSSFTITLNGSLDAEGKNADGEMAPHSLVFDGLEFSVSTSLGSLDDETALSSGAVQISCKGSVRIDGKNQSCEDLMKEESDDSVKNPVVSKSSSQVSNTSSYVSMVNGEGNVTLLLERSGKQVDWIERVLIRVDGDLEEFLWDEGPLDAEAKYLLGIQTEGGIESQFEGYSENAYFVHAFVSTEIGADISEIIVDVRYTDGTSEMIQKEL